MRQISKEHEPQHRAFLHYLDGEGLTPCSEVHRWRRRFWALVAFDAMVGLLSWILAGR